MKNHENQISVNGYTLTTLSDETAFYELKDEWEELWKKSPDATQFQRWEWQYLYYKHIIPNAPLKIFIVRDFYGECVALAAFCKIRDQLSGFSKAAFVGDSLADYHMILCKSGLPLSVGFQILDAIFKKSGRFIAKGSKLAWPQCKTLNTRHVRNIRDAFCSGTGWQDCTASCSNIVY